MKVAEKKIAKKPAEYVCVFSRMSGLCVALALVFGTAAVNAQDAWTGAYTAGGRHHSVRYHKEGNNWYEAVNGQVRSNPFSEYSRSNGVIILYDVRRDYYIALYQTHVQYKIGTNTKSWSMSTIKPTGGFASLAAPTPPPTIRSRPTRPEPPIVIRSRSAMLHRRFESAKGTLYVYNTQGQRVRVNKGQFTEIPIRIQPDGSFYYFETDDGEQRKGPIPRQVNLVRVFHQPTGHDIVFEFYRDSNPQFAIVR